jgi:hydroxyacyl-ACP dehydratase HTD2-like protein with hotdog domain
MEEIPARVIEMIGLEKERAYEVTRKDIKRFAQAIDDPNPRFRGEGAFEGDVHQTIVAPPLFCHVFAFEDVELAELPPDGSPVEISIPLPAEKTVGGGSLFEIFEAVRPGDHIRAKSKVADIYKKEGRSGTLFFISVETSFYNQSNRIVCKETATFIKR